METVRTTVPLLSDVSATAKQPRAHRLCVTASVGAHIQPSYGSLQHDLRNLRQPLRGRKDFTDPDSVIAIHDHCFPAGNHPPSQSQFDMILDSAVKFDHHPRTEVKDIFEQHLASAKADRDLQWYIEK